MSSLKFMSTLLLIAKMTNISFFRLLSFFFIFKNLVHNASTTCPATILNKNEAFLFLGPRVKIIKQRFSLMVERKTALDIYWLKTPPASSVAPGARPGSLMVAKCSLSLNTSHMTYLIIYLLIKKNVVDKTLYQLTPLRDQYFNIIWQILPTLVPHTPGLQ